ncbi:MAG: Gfo/Idh/MocA family oxidoreductase [Alkalispirochaeta sp.]
MIHLGIIGPGLIWENAHRDIIASFPEEFTVRAVAARSAHNQNRGRAFYPDARIYPDAQELIRDPEVEAVVVLTPISLNAPLAQAALEAGKHAIVEKPVARSVAEAQMLAEIAHHSSGVLYILEQHVHKPLIPAVRDLIGAGAIGEPVSFERSLHVRIAADDDHTGGYGSTAWRVDPDYPLGNFFDGGIHEVALLHELFGPARAIYARGRSLREGFGEVDLLSMVLEYDNEIQGVFAHSATLGKQGNRFVIRGTRGALLCSDREIRIIDAATGEEQLQPVQGDPENVTMWREVAAVLPEGGPGRYTPQAAVADISLMEALQASLRDARRVVVRSV